MLRYAEPTTKTALIGIVGAADEIGAVQKRRAAQAERLLSARLPRSPVAPRSASALPRQRRKKQSGSGSGKQQVDHKKLLPEVCDFVRTCSSRNVELADLLKHSNSKSKFAEVKGKLAWKAGQPRDCQFLRCTGRKQGFDTRGVLYWLGTRGCSRAYQNPCESGDVSVSWSSIGEGQVCLFVSHCPQAKLSRTGPTEGEGAEGGGRCGESSVGGSRGKGIRI
jgi:hypothetical protein